MVSLYLTAALSGTFSNLLFPFKLVPRYGIRFMNMISLVVLYPSVMICSLFVEAGPAHQGGLFILH
jgi:hypothetical protein